MTFKNIYYDIYKSEIHLWEQINGKNLYSKKKWIPYIFVQSNNSDIEDIFGNKVTKKEFNNFFDYQKFQKDNRCYENKLKPEIQYLVDKYHSIPDDEIEHPKLKIYSIDIEVYSEYHFPEPTIADDELCLINVTSFDGDSWSFGLKEYTGNIDINYTYCRSEKELLITFIKWWKKNHPDVITGWNIIGQGGFDFPYIVNRVRKLFGKDKNIERFLSPIEKIKYQEKEDSRSIEIAGISVIDYMDVFKWYHPEKLNSYSLDNVSKYVLDKGKLDYSEYGSLSKLYHENWNMYVDYNYIDNKRVLDLERKLSYINELVRGSSILCKVPMQYYKTQTQLMEGLLLTHLRRNKKCAPIFKGGEQISYKGAIVKEPIPGIYNYVFSIDIASSYPTAIITLNMSNETFMGKIVKISNREKYEGKDGEEKHENGIMESTFNKKFEPFEIRKNDTQYIIEGKYLENFNKALKKKLICVAPNGSVFSTKKQGCISTVEFNVFSKRKEIKKVIKELYKKENPDKVRIAQLNALQKTLKIMINGIYGVLAVPYSRYFNPFIAEAITSCGRQALLYGEKYCEEILKNPNEKIQDIFKRINES